MQIMLEIGLTYLCLILATSAVLGSAQDEIVYEEVNIQPGGEVHVIQKELHGSVSCKFTYSAQGGTNERWFIQISYSKDYTKFTCSVHRPEGRSYLFFVTFEMVVDGLRLVQAGAMGNSGPLKEIEYIVDKAKNTVKHAEGKFQSQLTQVEIRAQKGKSEL